MMGILGVARNVSRYVKGYRTSRKRSGPTPVASGSGLGDDSVMTDLNMCLAIIVFVLLSLVMMNQGSC